MAVEGIKSPFRQGMDHVGVSRADIKPHPPQCFAKLWYDKPGRKSIINTTK
jgi:hypothetical protein